MSCCLRVTICILLIFILLCILAIVIPPFTIIAYKTQEEGYWNDVNPIDQVICRVSDNRETLWINASYNPSEFTFDSYVYLPNTLPNLTLQSYVTSAQYSVYAQQYDYRCVNISKGGSVEYSVYQSGSVPICFFDYESFQQFVWSEKIIGNGVCIMRSSINYEWKNDKPEQQTTCVVVNNVNSSYSAQVRVTSIIKNYWYNVSNYTAEKSCHGSECCFKNVTKSSYIIVRSYYNNPSSKTTARLIVGYESLENIAPLAIWHIGFGSIALAFFLFILGCVVCCYCCCCRKRKRSNKSSSTSSYNSYSSSSRTRSYSSSSRTRSSYSSSSYPSVEMETTTRVTRKYIDLSSYGNLIFDFDGDEFRDARRYYNRAQTGDAEAIYQFGMCFKNYHGVKRDYTKAAELFVIAAERGSIDAVFELGQAFEKGHGVRKDYSKAVTLYQSASSRGSTEATVQLGYCYLNGTGIEQDINKAFELWTRAANAGNTMAKGILELYQKSSSRSRSSSSSSSTSEMKSVPSIPTVKTRAGDYSAARAHAPSSVSSITTNVTVNEAISRVRPDNVEVDLSEFSRFIPVIDTEECRNTRKLCDMAESGDAEAIYLFGLCFKKGFVVRRDYTRAALLFLIAAEKGNDDAVYELGVAFEDGNGVNQDYSKAVILYQAAALEGCTDAIVRLGFCYFNGTGIEEDHIKAIQLWILAAAAGNEMAKAIIETIQEALDD